MTKEEVADMLDRAAQLASIASDWDLDDVEINGEMVSVYTLMEEFLAGKEAILTPVTKESN